MSNMDRRRFLAAAVHSVKAGMAASVSSLLTTEAAAEPDLLFAPVSYGYRDHVVDTFQRAVRVYFPSTDSGISTSR